MKKRIIYTIIILMSIALASLIVLQGYWINNFYKLKKNHFDRIVSMSLNKVNDSIINLKLQSYKDSLEFDERFFTDKDSLKLLFSNDSLIKNFDNYYNNLRNISPKVFDVIEIDYGIIDSVVCNELSNLGIKTPFKYGIWSAKADTFIYLSNSEIDYNQLNSSKYRMALSSNIKDDIKLLFIYFPQRNLVIYKRMLFVLIPSLALILIILGSFWYAIKIILRQKKLSEMKTDFINNLTHEFKTPISTISLAIEGLLNFDVRTDESKAHEYLEIAKNENSRLGMMVSKVLKIAAYEKREIKLKLEKVNIEDIINKVTANFDVQVNHKGGNIEKKIDLPDPFITGDDEHLVNVIFNLLDNANKYSSENPEIKISADEMEEGIRIRISDNGIGIPKNQLKSIFNKFYRVPTKFRDKVKGFGLGLNYVQNIIEKHKGKISVQSEQDIGSTFEIILPRDHE